MEYVVVAIATAWLYVGYVKCKHDRYLSRELQTLARRSPKTALFWQALVLVIWPVKGIVRKGLLINNVDSRII